MPRLLALAALFVSCSAYAGEFESIYGDDNRREVDDPLNSPLMQEAAQSVAVIVPRSKILSALPGDDPQIYRSLPSTSLGSKYTLCPTEPFVEQPAPGYCTAFLVGPDLMATAGHCLKSSTDCANTAFVFDFVAGAAPLVSERIRKDNVYYCRTLLAQTSDPYGADFAVFRLDRVAAGRRPLPLRSSGYIGCNTPVTVIGHPNGLPLKIASGGQVRRTIDADFFVVNSDTFTGSSGSPVLNDETGQVEGVLVRGDFDFTYTPNHCNILNRCPENGCRGEDVVRTELFRKWTLPNSDNRSRQDEEP